jgi:hypothetical protein
MVEQKFCQECNERQKCQEVYEHLGKAEGPSVVLKVVLAFLLPLLVFIGLLAGFERVLARGIDAKELRTAVSLLLSVLGTLGVVLIIRMINKQLSRSR